MSGPTATAVGSAAVAAIGVAARQLGLQDPVTTADELINVDVDALDEWFTLAARASVWLFRGAARLTDAVPLLQAAWSNPAPTLTVARHQRAGLASREVVAAQVDAADSTGAVLRQSRTLADSQLDRAESSLLAMGWTAGEDLMVWAAFHDQVPAALAVVRDLAAGLEELQHRNTEALQRLALALRADPRDSVEQLARTGGPDAGSGAAGPPNPDLSHAGPPTGVEAENLDRLANDLRSTDPSTLAMALGVKDALDKARATGGVAQLLVYESAGSGSDGRAAISVGDIATADNVAVLAPGVGNAPANMAGGIADAVALRDRARLQAPGDETAVVSWYGYDMPLSYLAGAPEGPDGIVHESLAALDDSQAIAGSDNLISDLDHFRQWAPDTAHFVAIGFSMGSTLVSAAAARGVKLDDVVLLGSPGASKEAESADYPQIPADHTYALSFEQDPVTQPSVDMFAGLAGTAMSLVNPFALTGLPMPFSIPGPPGPPAPQDLLAETEPFGPDPASREFGAQVIDVRTNNPDITMSVDLGGLGGPLAGFVTSAVTNEIGDLAAHHLESNYLSGDALTAVADVLVAHYTDVPVKPGR